MIPTLGLADNVVYDVIAAVPFGFGNTSVSAFAYEVDCNALPHAAVVPGGGSDHTALVFNLNDELNTQVNVTMPRTSLTGLVIDILLILHFQLAFRSLPRTIGTYWTMCCLGK